MDPRPILFSRTFSRFEVKIRITFDIEPVPRRFTSKQ